MYDVWRRTEDDKTLASLKEGRSDFTERPVRRVARWTIANPYEPYVRGSQAHMFAALGSLAAAVQK